MGAKVVTNTALCDKLIQLHHIDRLIIPIHWDNFFSSLEQPIVGMPDLLEKTEVVFFKLARYCEAHDVNFLIQYPRTSIEI